MSRDSTEVHDQTPFRTNENRNQPLLKSTAMKITFRYFLAWFPIIFLAVANGTLRELGYKQFVGDLAAHWISTIVLILLFAGYLWGIGLRWKIESSRQAWTIGGMWLTMTVLFEFGFGHYIMGHPWEKLLHDYNVLQGRVWVLVLVAILLGPPLSTRWQRMRTSKPA